MEEDLKAASASAGDLPRKSSFAPHPKKENNGWLKKLVIVTGVILLLVAAGYAVWKYFLNDTPAQETPTQQAQQAATQAKSNYKPAEGTKQFSSTSLSTNFSYPADWTVTEKDGGIKIESPHFTYLTTQKGDVDGNFKVYVRKGARQVDSPYIGKGYAAKASQKLAYTNPAVGQRADTLLQTFGYDKSDNFAYIFLASSFQLNVGETLGPNYGKEPETILVVGGFSDPSLTDDFAMNSVPLADYENNPAYKQAVTMIQSLQFK